jgi:hypothetical protein
MHVHQPWQDEFVGKIYERYLAGHIRRVNEPVIDGRDAITLDSYRLPGFRCFTGHRQQRARMNNGGALVGEGNIQQYRHQYQADDKTHIFPLLFVRGFSRNWFMPILFYVFKNSIELVEAVVVDHELA